MSGFQQYNQDLDKTFLTKRDFISRYTVQGGPHIGLWAAGNNANNQLGWYTSGNSSFTQYTDQALYQLVPASSPVQVGSEGDAAFQSSWISIAIGSSTGSFAVRSDGALFGWGDNPGNLGLGSLQFVAYPRFPTQIGTSSWSMVSSSIVTYGIRKDSSLWTWGGSPVQLGTDSWTSISTLGNMQAAIRTDGALYTWGTDSLYAGYGALGQNARSTLANPTKLGSSSWLAVSSGGTRMAAIRADGALFIWGNNGSGQLGLGDTVHRSSPVQIGTSSWTTVSIGSTVAAIRKDGALFIWGDGSAGQFGDLTANYYAPRSSPVQVGTSSWSMVLGGALNIIATKIDSSVWVWGYNSFGQFGVGDKFHRSSPVQFGSLPRADISGIRPKYLATKIASDGNSIIINGISD